MTETSSSRQPPQIKTSSSLLVNNISPESPKHKESPLSCTFQEDNKNSSPTNKRPNNNKRPTFSQIFSFSYSNSNRSEVYQENDEFTTNGCFGKLCTLGSRMKYKVNNTWKY